MNDTDMSFIVLFAARYALPRQSMAVVIVTDFIERNRHLLSDGHRHQLVQDIDEELLRDRQWAAADHARWRALRRTLEDGR